MMNTFCQGINENSRKNSVYEDPLSENLSIQSKEYDDDCKFSMGDNKSNTDSTIKSKGQLKINIKKDKKIKMDNRQSKFKIENQLQNSCSSFGGSCSKFLNISKSMILQNEIKLNSFTPKNVSKNDSEPLEESSLLNSSDAAYMAQMNYKMSKLCPENTNPNIKQLDKKPTKVKITSMSRDSSYDSNQFNDEDDDFVVEFDNSKKDAKSVDSVHESSTNEIVSLLSKI